ncbi:ATP synthase F1 subunit gamma [Persicobacter sp. CCB-QB2]|uniref:ATP synthase F1 subunit gamma n=1 Tax=Persicobacter sp. CCB-QB2 TaxID=1561025 RepID=UPI0006A9BE7E|nr:ATP synthase F1 subunit gamma [Persicobacter sp. CCB-QB2]
MANLKEIKARIKSVNSTQQITKAMKLVAASKLRRAQDRIVQMRPYAQKFDEILDHVNEVSADVKLKRDFGQVREEIESVLVVVITSDRGLCGGFNTNAIKQANQRIENLYASQKAAGKLTILPIGKKAYEYYLKNGFNVVDKYYELLTDLSFASARMVAEYLMQSFIEGIYDQIDIVYNEFKNVATQILREETFLPTVSSEKEEGHEAAIDYIFDQDPSQLLDELIPYGLKVRFFRAVLESNASEHGARMTAMDKATENAAELLKELNLQYNRTRQAAITTEILEITAGAEALSNG